jgi:hypothetical protein
VISPNAKSRRGFKAGGGGNEPRLAQPLIKYVRWSPTFWLVTTSPCFFASDPPALIRDRVVCCCQPISLMISSSVAPPSRLSIAITRAVLLSSRGALALVSPVGTFFERLAFLVAAGVVGATSGACAPRVAITAASAVGVAGSDAVSGWPAANSLAA